MLMREFPEAEQFQDYREMLDKLGDKVDIVTVSTPDHTHAVAAIKAIKMGKHVYCQKPLTWSISEARMMRATSIGMGVVGERQAIVFVYAQLNPSSHEPAKSRPSSASSSVANCVSLPRTRPAT